MILKRCTLFIVALLSVLITHAQNQGITYSATNKPLIEILQDLEKISPYRFSYNSDIIGAEKTKTVQFTNASLESCMTKILGAGFSFAIVGNQVVITEKKRTPTTPKSTPKQQPPVIKEQLITVYDTVQVTDHVTIYDTIYEKTNVIERIVHIDTISLYEKNYLHSTNKCNIFSINNGFSFNSIKFYNSDERTIGLQNKYKNLLGLETQINFTHKHNNVLLQSGLNFYDFKIENSFSSTITGIDPNATYKDTVWYWKYRELLTYYKFNESGDSVAVTALDSTYTYSVFDHSKKVEKQVEKASLISWQYISIPFAIGWNFNLSDEFAIQPMLAINAMFLVHSTGEIVNKSNVVISSLDILRRVTYSAAIDCNFVYSIAQQYSISVKPFCLIAPSIFHIDDRVFDTQGRLTSFGLECGFSYIIPNGKQ